MGTKKATTKQAVKVSVKDLPAKNAKDVKGARLGGCDEFGCGTNHNETLLRD